MNTMTYKGYSAQIMEAERLTGEVAFGLPPGRAIDVYPAENFNIYPENWMKKGAFVVPVKPNKGLWFNFRMNDESNTAVLMTVKGSNPITGLPSSGFHLDKYIDKCPKHGCDFVSNRFCPECGYKWPDRSYLSGSPLWWDGWVCEGAVRQFFFTEDMMLDVATHMIGKENTVPAFGFAFYSPKEKRSSVSMNDIYHTYLGGQDIKYLVPPQNSYYSSGVKLSVNHSFDGSKLLGVRKRSLSSEGKSIGALYSCSSQSSDSMGVVLDSLKLCENNVNNECFTQGSLDTSMLRSAEPFTPEKEVSIGAGAKIRQELPEDSYPVDSWKDKPDSVMTIYFVFQEEFNKMAEGGFKDFKDCKDGMLSGIPVG